MKKSTSPSLGEAESAEIRARWVESLAGYVTKSLSLPRWQDCFDQLDTERANLEETLAWASTSRDESVLARAAMGVFRWELLLF